MTEVIVAPDGRRISVDNAGDPKGSPVFMLHGMPGSRLGPRPRAALLHQMGVRLISFDRPGYGGSDRWPDRCVADCAADVSAIARAYGLPKFAVIGRSGGGPHALACGALLPDRITKIAVLVSLAPTDAHDLNWFNGMADSNVREFAAAKSGRTKIERRLATMAAEIRANPIKLIINLQSDLGAADRQMLADPGLRSMLLETYSEAFRQSPHGWIDDLIALSTPWRFDLGAVAAPVLLWHGSNDMFTPPDHARWLAQKLRNARGVIAAGATHFSSFAAVPDILSWLTSQA